MTDISITHSIYDKDGNDTGKEKTIVLSADALRDIIDHATQIAILSSAGHSTEEIAPELSEALSSYGLIDTDFIAPSRSI